MVRGEEVSMVVLNKICDKYDCDYGDIINHVNQLKARGTFNAYNIR